MAQQIGSLFASLSLDSTSFVSGLKRSTEATERASTAIQGGMSRIGTAVKGAMGVFAANAAIDTAHKLLEIADAGKKLEGQLRLATKEFGSYGQAQRDVARIAAETRSNLNETGILYGKNMRGVKELGGSQNEAALMTENFNKAMKVGNANTQEITSATLAWGQAMNSGKMEGEDYNSIIDASPPLIEALARALKKPIGSMKALVEEGKVTSRVMVDALTKPEYTKKLVDDFKDVPRTWEESVTLMENQAQVLVSSFDQGSGLSNAIVNLFQGGIDGSTDMGKAATDVGIQMRGEAMATAQMIRNGFEELSTAFEPFRSAAASVFGEINQQAVSSRDYVMSLLKTIDNIRNAPMDAALWMRDRAKNDFGVNMPRNWFVPDDQQRSDIAGNWGRNYDRETQTRRGEGILRGIADNAPAYGRFKPNEIGDWFNQRGRFDPKLRNRRPPTPAAGGSGSGHKPRVRSAEQIAREKEREAETARRDLEAFRSDRARSERDELDSKADLATIGKQRFDFERQQLESDRQNRIREIENQGPKGSKRFTEAQVAELKAIEERIAANRRQLSAIEEAEFHTQEQSRLTSASLENAQEMAQLDLSMARTAKDRRASEHRLLDLRMQQEKLALDAIIASRDATEAEKEIARLRLAILPELRRKEGQRVDERNKGPLGDYLDRIPRTGEEINEALEGVQVDGLQSLESGLMDCIKGVGSLGDAFGNMADTVIDGLIKIALQQMIIKPLGDLMFGGSGGGGGLFGSLVSGIKGAATGGLGGVPGKANGGLGNRGRVLVGEHGPELLDMGGPYNVIPNHKLDGVRGGGQPTMNITFGAITSNDPEQVKAMATEAIVQMMPMINQNAANHTLSKLQRPRV